MKNKTVYIESLGCCKNTVDSEILLRILKERGFRRTNDPKNAAHIIVNTCSFIDEAKEEAIDVIFELARYKQFGARLIIAGCFPQLYSREIVENMPEVDAVIGNGNLNAIIDAVESESDGKEYPQSRIIPEKYTEYPDRSELLSPKGYAYIKISEGCSRNCSFCLIPRIKGRQRSRKIEDIVREAGWLERLGVKELILTSQDTLSYGNDLGKDINLKNLIQKLLTDTGFKYIRLLYLRPGYELLKNLELFDDSRILPYFDIPIQHVSAQILKNMKREGSSADYQNVIEKIRKRFPHSILRTTIIVGFPGEKKKDFGALIDFIQEIRFNHLGVFIYSPQRETSAYGLNERVDTRTAEARKKHILSVQRTISEKLLNKEKGKLFDVLIEETIKTENISIGRSYHFAPDVDGLFIVSSYNNLEPGSIVRAKVTHSDEYDLHGVAL